MALAGAPENLAVHMLRRPDKASLMAALQGAEFLISERAGVVDAEMIENAPNLKLIQRLGSLVHDIDLEAASQAGIAVCYLPVTGSIKVAEHLVMQVLALSKKLREVEAVAREASPEWGESRRTDEDTFAYNWSRRLGVGQVWEQTVGIIGFGEVGVEFARRLGGWGCSLLYHKRSPLPARVEASLGVTYAEKEALFSQSDILVNLLPYSAQTDSLLNAAVFEHMKTGACLVSCGSGGTIDEAALAAAVQAGKLAGAALDSFAYEPLRADNPLVAAARKGFNILLTPHTAAGTPPSATEQGARAPRRSGDYVNITNYLAGRTLKYRVI
jgi:phosphoglycerate dehydrogenase-like enzyme